MGVCAIRIDARLIHGQVATLWQGVWNCNRIMVIDSKSANDPMLKSVLKIACPSTVRLSVLEAETAAANLLSGKYGAERITIVTKDPSNLLTLLEKGFRPECDVTVGNMSGGNGKFRVTRNIACTPGEVESFKKLDGMEIKLFSQTVPSEVPSPFMPQLESALKQAQ